MKSNYLVFICALLCFISSLGCLTDRSVIDKYSVGKTRAFKKGEAFSVKLKGYIPLEPWKLTAYDKTVLTLVSKKSERVGDPPASGMGTWNLTVFIFNFKATKKGETTILLQKKKHRESNQSKKDVFEKASFPIKVTE